MKELTYKDFKIGQKVTCVKVDDTVDQHLTVGKQYVIKDVDFHFWDAICVRSDNNKISMFMKIKYFSDIKYVRKLKIEKLKKNNDKV